MLSVIRRAVAVASLVVVSASVGQAQVGIREIRIDFASLVTTGPGGGTVFSLGGPNRPFAGLLGTPASVALGVYLSDKFALEPSMSLSTIKPEGADLTLFFGLGLWAPYYFDSGRSGLFVAPGFEVLHVTEENLMIDYGADIGFKKAINDNLSWRAAAGLRLGDSVGEGMLTVATFGFSWFPK